MSEAFDVIPYEDIKGDWKKLGSGSFGNVYKGTYLGIEVAIKEVLPSNEYDVAKYFEREWRLMKEARHPNVVLYLGLSRAPQPDSRIFIVSEFIENGNLRQYIYSKSSSHPFPWRMRISFATDIARALAYLHARNCLHRDLKGENLLLTSNGRLKITDFGFARITPRSSEEQKRLTFCGTDSYMSPEVLLGEEFGLPTDIFSLGIIFCEIAARKLADDNHLKRSAPTFGLDFAEVRELASPGCPPAFVQLCIECTDVDPTKRPTTRNILERLRDIEAEVLSRPNEGDDVHVGSIKFMTGAKRPGVGPRIPSFGMGVGKDIRGGTKPAEDSSDDDSDDELVEAVLKLSKVNLDPRDLSSSWSDGTTGHSAHESTQPLIPQTSSSYSDYSTTVIRQNNAQPRSSMFSTQHTQISSDGQTPPLSEILTIRTPLEGNSAPGSMHPYPVSADITPPDSRQVNGAVNHQKEATETSSILTTNSYHTASGSSIISTAAATHHPSVLSGGGSTIRNAPLVHRFTLIKPGANKPKLNKSPSGGATPLGTAATKRSDRSASPASRATKTKSPVRGNVALPGVGSVADVGLGSGAGWNPLDLFFSSGLLVAKCDVCLKRLGWKPVLECDDCGLRAHVKCGEIAPRDCGIRPARPTALSAPTNYNAISPLSKLKYGAKVAGSPPR